MQKLHAKLPARQSFISDADLKFAWLAFDKDKSNKLEGEEIRGLFQNIFDFDIFKGNPVQQEYSFPQFKTVLEDMHRRYPQWNVAGRLMQKAREQADAKKPEVEKVVRAPTKKALLVGINYLGTSNQLGGCINDSRNELEILTKVFGFPAGNILLLTEDQNDSSKLPTCANIRQGLRWLVSGAQPGDFLFFAYSGHGSQVADKSKEEEDGQDECICPLDCMNAWPQNLILDDELNTTFNDRLPDGVSCVCVYDCCHSGSMEDLSCTLQLRQASTPVEGAALVGKDITGRYLAPPAHAEKDLAPIRDVQKTQDAKPRALKDQGCSSTKNIVVVSGCQDNQTSADATINGKRQGALTWALMKALKDHSFSITYEDLLVAVRANLKAGQYTQIAAMSSTCESNFAKLYLDGPADPAAVAVLATSSGGGSSSAGLASNLVWAAIFVVGLALGWLFPKRA